MAEKADLKVFLVSGCTPKCRFSVTVEEEATALTFVVRDDCYMLGLIYILHAYALLFVYLLAVGLRIFRVLISAPRTSQIGERPEESK